MAAPTNVPPGPPPPADRGAIPPEPAATGTLAGHTVKPGWGSWLWGGVKATASVASQIVLHPVDSAIKIMHPVETVVDALDNREAEASLDSEKRTLESKTGAMLPLLIHEQAEKLAKWAPGLLKEKAPAATHQKSGIPLAETSQSSAC